MSDHADSWLLPASAPTRRVLVLGVGAAALFAGLTAAVAWQIDAVTTVDETLHRWAVTERTDTTIAFARSLSFVGAGRITVPTLMVVGALALPSPRPWTTRIASGAVLGGLAAVGGSLGVAVNRYLERARPLQQDWAGNASLNSFPSGHTTTATLFSAACVWALVGRVRPGRGRVALVAGFTCFAVAVGWSRVWLGVHWPSDVVGGWSYALAWSTLVAALTLALARSRAGRRAKAEVDRADARELAGDGEQRPPGGAGPAGVSDHAVERRTGS